MLQPVVERARESERGVVQVCGALGVIGRAVRRLHDTESSPWRTLSY
ncbi:MAG: hypothetical protein ACTIME_16875 [Cellulosimicrobium funkei]|nr:MULTISPECIES: hypothetical protein [Cellulosimicrobium]